MADLKDKQIRLVGSENFAYATGSKYTQGHIHFTTDEHGSIVVNGKVYGTTDASYVYVGSKNIPTYVVNTAANTLALSYAYTDARINALDGNPLAGNINGNFVSYVAQEDGNITAYKDTLETLVNVDNSEAKAYAPKGTNENVKFIKSFEIEGDRIIPRWDYLGNNIPNIGLSYDNYSGYYLPEFSASGHTITITNGAQVVSYNEFSEHLEEVKEIHELVDRFFSGAELDTETVKSYIDTLSEIQEAFKNSYAEGIANSVNNIKFHGNNDNANSYQLWITYTTNGSSTAKESAYVNIPYATDTAYGLAKYDDSTIKKNPSGQLSVNYDDNTIKKNPNGQLYVNGQLTDTKYSLDAAKYEDGAYIKLVGTDGTASTIQFKGTGIAEITYNSTNKVVEINVPETVVNYNHHSSNGRDADTVVAYIDGSAGHRVITNVSLSSDGKLTYSYAKLEHGVNEASFVNVTYGSNVSMTYTAVPGASMELKVPSIKVNKCGHVVDLKENTVRVNFNHDHDEFVWL